MNKNLSILVACSTLMLAACQQGNSSQHGENLTLDAATKMSKRQQVTAQGELDSIARALQVTYQHLTNVVGEHCDKTQGEGACFKAKLSFTSPQAIRTADWQIYFSQISPIQSFESDDLVVEHLNGDLHRITLAKGSTGFKAGETKSLIFNAIFWSVSEFDAIPNYIINREGLTPRVIASTQAIVDPETGLETLPFVAPYTNKDTQFKRTPGEQTQWATSEVLFENNAALGQTESSVAAAIIPTPMRTEIPPSAGRLNLSQGLKVNFNQLAKSDLISALERLASLGVKTTADGVAVNLTLDQKLGLSPGHYRLKVSAAGIDIVGGDISGVYYGLQSLASLVTVGRAEIPYLSIIDSPRYQFRGMHLDVARNFFAKEFIIELIGQMAAYKLNKLHLHLADDEGWRLQIPGLPELTDVGGKRCLDFTEQRCLLPQLGAGVDQDSPVNGYYTVSDYQEILRVASAHHIQVIPSLDMPGHSRSSVKAMTARYHRLMALGETARAKEFLLYDLADPTKYSSVQFYNDNTINVCMESSYAFINKVMDEVKAIHAGADHPLTRYHIGADETAGAWVESPECKDFIANNPDDITKPEQLGAYFIERVAKILASKDIETAGWSDGLLHTRVENMPKVVQANSWGNLFWGGHKENHQMINQGWDVVFSSPEVLYFDFPYEADPKEHGYYWAARHSNSRKIFEMMPGNLPAHAEIWRDRMELPFEVVDDSASILANGKSLSGIQGQLWTETTRSATMAQYKIYPRLLALAERAWHKPTWELPYQATGATYNQSTSYFTPSLRQTRDGQWQGFAKTVARKEMPKLDLAGINYRIPTVGAKIVDGKLAANIIFPQLRIQYRVNGGQWQWYQGLVAVSGKVEVRALAADGRRKGRIISVSPGL